MERREGNDPSHPINPDEAWLMPPKYLYIDDKEGAHLLSRIDPGLHRVLVEAAAHNRSADEAMNRTVAALKADYDARRNRARDYSRLKEDYLLTVRFEELLRIKMTHKVSASRVSLGFLNKLTDWVPFAQTRKDQRKLLADEQAEIARFMSERREMLARWRAAWAWIHWTRYLLSTPFAAAAKAILTVFKIGTGA